MKRLCFMSPDHKHATAVVADLKADGIDQRHIYAVARSNTLLEDLPDGGGEDNDFIPAFKRGITLGGAAGVFAGLLAVAFPPTGIVIGGGAVLLLGAMGASMGGLLTGMAGASFPNSRLQAFEQDIDDGKILIMVDVPDERVDHINQLISQLDPSIEIEGVEPPAPFLP